MPKKPIYSPVLIIREKAEKYPDFPVLTFEDGSEAVETLTYSELVCRGNRLAIILKKLGVNKGDSVAVVMLNHPEMIVAFYAIIILGAIFVPLDPRATWEKIAYLIRHAESKVVIFSADLSESMKNVLSVQPELQFVALRQQKNASPPHANLFRNYDAILHTTDFMEIEPVNFESRNHYMMLYTSGTVGVPKAVKLRNELFTPSVSLAKDVWQYSQTDKLYTGLPMTHGNAWLVTLFPALHDRIPAVIGRQFDKDRIWDICRQHDCTSFSLLGGLSADLYFTPEKPDDGHNPVRKVVSAGMPEKIWKAFERRFAVKVHEWYGALEGGFAHNPPGLGPVGSFGEASNPYFDMRVVTEDHRDCRPGEVGELIYRSKHNDTIVEYHNNPLASRAKVRDGWVLSGDMVHRDKEGWLFFDYRIDNQLRHHGEFVSAMDIENVLIEHPDVKQVCVFGIDAASGSPGEHDLVAAIVPITLSTPNIHGLYKWCIRHLKPSNIPSYIQITPHIPQTGTGKVMHRQLVAEFTPEDPNVYSYGNYCYR